MKIWVEKDRCESWYSMHIDFWCTFVAIKGARRGSCDRAKMKFSQILLNCIRCHSFCTKWLKFWPNGLFWKLLFFLLLKKGEFQISKSREILTFCKMPWQTCGENYLDIQKLPLNPHHFKLFDFDNMSDCWSQFHKESLSPLSIMKNALY